jgi:hypothetical protein
LVQYKKHLINLFSLQYEKKKREEKEIKRKKNKIKNILRGKKLKGKKLVAGVLGTTLLCTIHGATVEKKLKMTMVQIHSVLLTQLKHFYILKKYCY